MAVVEALREHRVRPSSVGVFVAMPSWPTIDIADGTWRIVVADLAASSSPSHWTLDCPTVLLALQLPTEQVLGAIADMPCAVLAPRALMELLHYTQVWPPVIADETTIQIVSETFERLLPGELTNVAALRELLADREQPGA